MCAAPKPRWLRAAGSRSPRRKPQCWLVQAATLDRHPRLGRRVPDVDRDDIRQVLYGMYRIVYRIDPKRVVVLTVRHGRRLWAPSEVDPD
jgi:plasmid stabilization system protein ParE